MSGNRGEVPGGSRDIPEGAGLVEVRDTMRTDILDVLDGLPSDNFERLPGLDDSRECLREVVSGDRRTQTNRTEEPHLGTMGLDEMRRRIKERQA